MRKLAAVDEGKEGQEQGRGGLALWAFGPIDWQEG
jgi:hypothetical protein